MGLLGWLRRRRQAGRAAPVPATNVPPEEKKQKAESPKPLDREIDEARAQAHGHSHLTG